jgi:hypothetical protein
MAEANLVTVCDILHHRTVLSTPYRGDRLKFAETFLSAFNDLDDKFPIDLSTVWEALGYPDFEDALNRLADIFQKDVNYNVKFVSGAIAMTYSGFQVLATCAQTKRGADLKDFFLACRYAFCDLGPCQSPVEKLLAMHHMTGCLYVAVIQESPERVCKFGQTHDLRRRTLEHKRTFVAPYCFELLHVVAAGDPRKAEEIFRNLPEVKGHATRVSVGDDTLRETFKMPDTFTVDHLQWCMESAAEGSSSRPASDAFSLQKSLSLRASKQVIDDSARIRKLQLDHEFRTAQLEKVVMTPLATWVGRVLNRERDDLQTFLDTQCRRREGARTLQADFLATFRRFCNQDVAAEEVARLMGLKGFARRKNNSRPRQFYYPGIECTYAA